MTALAVIISAFAQAYIIQVFIRPANLLSSGFTGVSIMIEKITSTFFGFSFSTSLAMIALNIPVALICYKHISPRFTFFSLMEVFLASFFLKVIDFPPIFDDILLNVSFGGFCYGLMTLNVLRANASTGGTDFIALFVSNRKGKSIWSYVFIFNTCILIIFGFLFGWDHAGYSILFQFISTRTIDSFYHRYDQLTLQITTEHADAVCTAYFRYFKHGISCTETMGAYSHKKMYLLNTVVSSYEERNVVDLVREVDPQAIINVYRTENFYGPFYRKPIE